MSQSRCFSTSDLLHTLSDGLLVFLKGTTVAFPRWACLVCRAAPLNVLAASDFCIAEVGALPLAMQLWGFARKK